MDRKKERVSLDLQLPGAGREHDVLQQETQRGEEDEDTLHRRTGRERMRRPYIDEQAE